MMLELVLFCLVAAVLIDGHFTRRSLNKMALDLTTLSAAVELNTAATNAAVAALAAAKAEPDQSAVDALTSTITANNATLNQAANPGA